MVLTDQLTSADFDAAPVRLNTGHLRLNGYDLLGPERAMSNCGPSQAGLSHGIEFRAR